RSRSRQPGAVGVAPRTSRESGSAWRSDRLHLRGFSPRRRGRERRAQDHRRRSFLSVQREVGDFVEEAEPEDVLPVVAEAEWISALLGASHRVAPLALAPWKVSATTNATPALARTSLSRGCHSFGIEAGH